MMPSDAPTRPELPSGFRLRRREPAPSDYRSKAAGGDFDLRFPVPHLARAVLAVALAANAAGAFYVASSDLGLRSLPLVLFGGLLAAGLVRVFTHPSPTIRRRGDRISVTQPLAFARTLRVGELADLEFRIHEDRALYATSHGGEALKLVAFSCPPVDAHDVKSWLEEELGV